MKKISTLLFVLIALDCSAQWSNISNQFYDSLHMPVCTEVLDQTNSMSITSYPDGGTIVFWEDRRRGFYDNGQIFAQKFDKTGNRLWAENGIPVSTGTNNQHFTFSSNQDYRNRSVAASDKAGGFYITYTDDSIATYAWQRMCVQHIKSDGGTVFGGVGFIAAQTPAGESFNYAAPLLIADENGGFYISYVKKVITDYVYVYCYKDEGGIMKSYGGGLVNENAISRKDPMPCLGAFKWSRDYPVTTIIDYNIFPDLMGGCSVVMDMNGNTGDQYRMICYNKLFRVKKDSRVVVPTRFPTGDADSLIVNYKSGDVGVLYQMRNSLLNRECVNPDIGHILWVDDVLLSNGYQVIDGGGLDYAFPKGVTLSTTGNINVEFIAFGKRVLVGGTASDASVLSIALAGEKYDSIPFQKATYQNPDIGYNPTVPANLNTLNYSRDTILSSAVGYFDFTLAGGGNQLYASALMREIPANLYRTVKLQHLSVEPQGAGTFGIVVKTSSKKGEVIGKEVSTGFGSSEILYDTNPEIVVNNTGNALFYINEYGRYTRVSPIGEGAELTWGAMGKPIGTPIVYGAYYYPTLPYVSLNATDGTGVVNWQDQRILPANTRSNIFMRHLDNLNEVDYTPTNKKLQLLPIGNFISNPAVITGSSKKYSTLEVYNPATGTTSPIVEILDNYNLGSVPVDVYQNIGAIRIANSKPYLDRNYTIKPENNPNGAATINVRLFFTTTEFNALKVAEPAITDPGSLAVIKQSNATGNAPAAYVPVSGDEVLIPSSWKAVPGGYYVEVSVTSFSNFFIQYSAAALPVKWLGVQGQWQNATNAKISWQVAEQQNVKSYTVQHSPDGRTAFGNICTVPASAITSYNCIVPANNTIDNYYRVLQEDVDGAATYSKVVVLRSTTNVSLAMYPNPAKDMLYIEGANDYRSLEITDAYGRVVRKQNISAGIQSINISSLPTGVYAVIIRGDKKTQTLRFIKN